VPRHSDRAFTTEGIVGELHESEVSRHRAIRVGAAALAVAVAVGVALALSESGPARITSSPGQLVYMNCPSVGLGGTLPAAVYLPPGYRDGHTRYPVVYFLHGLPAGPTSYQGYGFVSAAVEQTGHRAIVVAPQGARNAGDDREYLNWGRGEDWPLAIARDLPRCIDARLRTIASRGGRALIGLSAGGFGAFNIGLRHLATFAAIESWSGYFAATDPEGLHLLDLGSKRANRKARVPRDQDLDERLAIHPAFIGFYVGRQDGRFYKANVDLDAAFTAGDVSHLFHVYPGGHSTSLWLAQAPYWVGLALAHLRAPTGGA
jgi:enterochelin esterase-like enzyme